MPPKGLKKASGRVVALDGDKLGAVVGAVLAIIVMALCFFMRQVDGFTVATRVGWAFVAGYGATFFLVRFILRTTLIEFVEHQKEKKESRRKLQRGEKGSSDEGQQ